MAKAEISSRYHGDLVGLQTQRHSQIAPTPDSCPTHVGGGRLIPALLLLDSGHLLQNAIVSSYQRLEVLLVLSFHYFVSRYNNSCRSDYGAHDITPKPLPQALQNAIVDHADTTSWLLEVQLMYGMASVF